MKQLMKMTRIMKMTHLTRNINHLLGLVAALPLLLAALSCSDSVGVDSGRYGNAITEVTLDMKYTPSMVVNDINRTRSAGTAVQGIDNVFVAFYKVSDGSLAKAAYLVRGDGLTVVNQDRTPSGDPCDEDMATSHATGKVSVGEGSYHAYAVANMGDLRNKFSDIQLASETSFKGLHFEWDSTNISNNREMSGFFTLGGDLASYTAAPNITVGKSPLTLHSWVKRQASKITVGFDGSNLNDNITIHILSVQVKDIASHGTIINPNTPGAACPKRGKATGYTSSDIDGKPVLIGNGEKLVYATEAEYESSPIKITKGNPRWGDHSSDAEALFFYENMQGVDSNAKKHTYAPDTLENGELKCKKDSVEYGTYVEVRGMYFNRNFDRPSHGPIVYRFMLGKNVTDNFNAERNIHYKLTLKFKNDANDPDWHIEYKEPTPPSLDVTTPLYISYMYDTYLNIPITFYYDTSMDPPIVRIEAEILDSDWGYSGHPYYGNAPLYDNDAKNGFMSFKKPGSVMGSVDSCEKTITVTSDQLDYAGKTDKAFLYNLPIYTQALNMEHQFSGNNFYINSERHGHVHVKIFLNDESMYDGTTEIIQVKRIENPKAKWWPAGNNTPFHVVLMESSNVLSVLTAGQETYYPLVSTGTWKASVLYGGDDFEICRTETGVYSSTDTVAGSIDEQVEFYVQPKGNGTNGAPKFGVVEIWYNNLTCRTLMLLAQGYGDCNVGGNMWEMSNLEKPGEAASNPVKEGSMFKIGNPYYAFKATNNLRTGFTPFEQPYDKNFNVFRYNNGAITSTTAKFGKVCAYDNSTGDNSFENAIMKNGGYRVATGDDYKYFDVTSDDFEDDRYLLNFGIIYGAECNEPLTQNATIYTNDGDVSGMRACFVFDGTTKQFLILPIGNQSCGRRQIVNWPGWGHNAGDPSRMAVLKYADRPSEMAPSAAVSNPVLYDLYRKPGAVYLYHSKYKTNYGFDVNYFSYQINDFNSKVYRASCPGSSTPSYETLQNTTYFTWPNSDAAYVRRVKQ